MPTEEFIFIMKICCAANLVCSFLQWNRGNTKIAMAAATIAVISVTMAIVIRKGIIS